MWRESPNSPDEALLQTSRNGDRHPCSKDDIQGQNAFKFQNSRELCKTTKLDMLKLKQGFTKKDRDLWLCQI